MKELSIEQKAQRYDEAIKRASNLHKDAVEVESDIIAKTCETIFPELEESEDERIRKWIIDDIIYNMNNEALEDSEYKKQAKKAIDWLGKQGEQELNDDEDILQRFSFYSYKDEPNILYLSGLYVNPKHRSKGIGTKILTIADKVAESMCCKFIRLKTKIGSNAERLYRRNEYNTLKKEGNQIWLEKQCEQKPTWSGEDENRFTNLISLVKCSEENDATKGGFIKFINKLKLLKPQNTWKPSDEKKLTNESKFKVGDWIISDYNNVAYIESISETKYNLQCKDGHHEKMSIEYVDRCWRPWTIADVKPGDVLYTPKGVVVEGIFLIEGWEQVEYTGKTLFSSIGYRVEDDKIVAGGLGAIWWEGVIVPFYPATKEQCDTLFERMKEEGYEWDAEKLELKKMEHITIPKFKVGDKVYPIRSRFEFECTIESIDEETYYGDTTNFDIKDQDDWKLIERKPIWSEEDERMITSILGHLERQKNYQINTTNLEQCQEWLKSLKDRVITTI